MDAMEPVRGVGGRKGDCRDQAPGVAPLVENKGNIITDTIWMMMKLTMYVPTLTT